MLMDVCHVLLGILWQYDRDVTYDGRENIFTFKKVGRNHTLIPLNDEKLEEQAILKVMLISNKDFFASDYRCCGIFFFSR